VKHNICTCFDLPNTFSYYNAVQGNLVTMGEYVDLS
jgi:hypothetical protein